MCIYNIHFWCLTRIFKHIRTHSHIVNVFTHIIIIDSQFNTHSREILQRRGKGADIQDKFQVEEEEL